MKSVPCAHTLHSRVLETREKKYSCCVLLRWWVFNSGASLSSAKRSANWRLIEIVIMLSRHEGRREGLLTNESALFLCEYKYVTPFKTGVSSPKRPTRDSHAVLRSGTQFKLKRMSVMWSEWERWLLVSAEVCARRSSWWEKQVACYFYCHHAHYQFKMPGDVNCAPDRTECCLMRSLTRHCHFIQRETFSSVMMLYANWQIRRSELENAAIMQQWLTTKHRTLQFIFKCFYRNELKWLRNNLNSSMLCLF